MANFLLLAIDIWVISGLLLFLHAQRPRFGPAPMLIMLGAVTFLLAHQVGVYITPFPDLPMFLGSNALVPVLVLSVLVLYVTDGASSARAAILSMLGVNVFILLSAAVYRLHLALPTGGALDPARVAALFPALDPRVTVASLVAFVADLFVIVIFYQGVKNVRPRWPEWVVVGLALLAAMWTDAILFNLFSELGTEDFARYLPGDLVGKTFSALLLWPVAAYYLAQVAPRLPGYQGGAGRPALDVFYGTSEATRRALHETTAALARSEAERQREAAYLTVIADHIDEALWLAEIGQTQPFYVNRAYERIWGHSLEALAADPLINLNAIHPDDRERVLLEALPNNAADGYDVQYRVCRPDGSVRWVHDQAFPVRNAAGEVERIAGVTADITELKLAQDRQTELEAERQRVTLLREFVTEATQDFKNPLTAINLRIYQLARSDDPEKRQAYLHELRALLDRMGKTIEDLLTLTRLESRLSLPAVQLNIDQLVREVCDGFGPLAAAKQLELVIRPAGVAPMVRTDRDDLVRALVNVLENAVQYTPIGGRVTITTTVTADAVRLTVRDTGIGIAPADLPQVFNRFYRAANARLVDPGGTGLGLAIVKRIVEQHGGALEIDSPAGGGTTVALTLPRAD